MRVHRRIAAVAMLAAAAACSHGAARTNAAPPASTSTQPSNSAVAQTGDTPGIDTSQIDGEMAALDADLTGTDQGLNSSQEGDVNR